MSSKKVESFKGFQQFVEVKELKILRPGKTFVDHITRFDIYIHATNLFSPWIYT